MLQSPSSLSEDDVPIRQRRRSKGQSKTKPRKLDDKAGKDAGTSKKFIIPRRKKAKELFETQNFDTREAKDLLRTITQSFYQASLCSAYNYEKITIVHNTRFSEQYSAKKQEMRQEGYAQKEVEDSYAYLFLDSWNKVKKISKEGLSTGSSSCSTLGDPSMGVYLSRFPDLVSPQPLASRTTGFLMVFKVAKGKLKAVGERTSHGCTLEPTPNYDGHISKLFPPGHKVSMEQAYLSSRYYIYEFMDDGDDIHARRPRQCCPYAVIQFSVTVSQYQYKDLSTWNFTSANDLETPVKSSGDGRRYPDYMKYGRSLWSGVIKNKENVLSKADLICYSQDELSFSIGEFIDIKAKAAYEKLKPLLPSPIFTQLPVISGKCKAIDQKTVYIYCEIRPEEKNTKLDKLISYFLSRSLAGVAEFPDSNACIYVIPTSEFSHQLGLTDQHYPDILHAVLVKRLPKEDTHSNNKRTIVSHVDPVAEAAVIRDIRKELQQIQFQQIKKVSETNTDLDPKGNDKMDTSDNDKENAKDSEDVESPSTFSAFKSPPWVQTHPAVLDSPFSSLPGAPRGNEVIRHFRDPRLIAKSPVTNPSSPSEIEIISSDESPKMSPSSVSTTPLITDRVQPAAVTTQQTSSNVEQSVTSTPRNETATETNSGKTTTGTSSTTPPATKLSRLSSRLNALFARLPKRPPNTAEVNGSKVLPVPTLVTTGSSETPKTTSSAISLTVSLLATDVPQQWITTPASSTSTTMTSHSAPTVPGVVSADDNVKEVLSSRSSSHSTVVNAASPLSLVTQPPSTSLTPSMVTTVNFPNSSAITSSTQDAVESPFVSNVVSPKYVPHTSSQCVDGAPNSTSVMSSSASVLVSYPTSLPSHSSVLLVSSPSLPTYSSSVSLVSSPSLPIYSSVSLVSSTTSLPNYSGAPLVSSPSLPTYSSVSLVSSQPSIPSFSNLPLGSSPPSLPSYSSAPLVSSSPSPPSYSSVPLMSSPPSLPSYSSVSLVSSPLSLPSYLGVPLVSPLPSLPNYPSAPLVPFQPPLPSYSSVLPSYMYSGMSFPPLPNYSNPYNPLTAIGRLTSSMQQTLVQYPPIKPLRTWPIHSNSQTSSVLSHVSSVPNDQSPRCGTRLEVPISDTLSSGSPSTIFKNASSPKVTPPTGTPGTPTETPGTPTETPGTLLVGSVKSTVSNISQVFDTTSSTTVPVLSNTSPVASISTIFKNASSPMANPPAVQRIPLSKSIVPAVKPTANNSVGNGTKPSAKTPVSYVSHISDTTSSTIVPERLQVNPIHAQELSDSNVDSTTALPETSSSTSCVSMETVTSAVTSVKELSCGTSIKKSGSISEKQNQPYVTSPSIGSPSSIVPLLVSAPTENKDMTSDPVYVTRKKKTVGKKKTSAAQSDNLPPSVVIPAADKNVSVVAPSPTQIGSEGTLSEPSVASESLADGPYPSQVSLVFPVAVSDAVSIQSSDAHQPVTSTVTCLTKCETPSKTAQKVTVVESCADQLILSQVPPTPSTSPAAMTEYGGTVVQSFPADNLIHDDQLSPTISCENKQLNIAQPTTADCSNAEAMPIPIITVSNRIPSCKYSPGLRLKTSESPTLPNTQVSTVVPPNTSTWFPFPTRNPTIPSQTRKDAMPGDSLPNNGWSSQGATFGSHALTSPVVISPAPFSNFPSLTPTSQLTLPISPTQYPCANTPTSNPATALLCDNRTPLPYQMCSPTNTLSAQAPMHVIPSAKPVGETCKTTEDTKVTQIPRDLGVASGFGYTKRYPDVFLNVPGDPKITALNNTRASSPQKKAVVQTNTEAASLESKRVASPLAKDNVKLKVKLVDQMSEDREEQDNVSASGRGEKHDNHEKTVEIDKEKSNSGSEDEDFSESVTMTYVSGFPVSYTSDISTPEHERSYSPISSVGPGDFDVAKLDDVSDEMSLSGLSTVSEYLAYEEHSTSSPGSNVKLAPDADLSHNGYSSSEWESLGGKVRKSRSDVRSRLHRDGSKITSEKSVGRASSPGRSRDEYRSTHSDDSRSRRNKKRSTSRESTRPKKERSPDRHHRSLRRRDDGRHSKSRTRIEQEKPDHRSTKHSRSPRAIHRSHEHRSRDRSHDKTVDRSPDKASRSHRKRRSRSSSTRRTRKARSHSNSSMSSTGSNERVHRKRRRRSPNDEMRSRVEFSDEAVLLEITKPGVMERIQGLLQEKLRRTLEESPDCLEDPAGENTTEPQPFFGGISELIYAQRPRPETIVLQDPNCRYVSVEPRRNRPTVEVDGEGRREIGRRVKRHFSKLWL